MSELRQDLVSGDWIIVAPERAKLPRDFLPEKNHRKSTPLKTCPFEDLQKSGNWPLTLSYPDQRNWEAVMIPNKYPALLHVDSCPPLLKRGPYAFMAGMGYHDLIVTRDHKKNFAHLTLGQATKVFELLQERYQMLVHDKCLAYTSFFFNWGPTAGASLAHPHFQVLTLPIVPHDIANSLRGSHRYFKKHKKCVHCDIIRYERKYKQRIVEENDLAIAFAPFASHRPFEMRVFPKKHLSCFERTPRKSLEAVASVLQSVLRRFEKHLNDPDLNFFIHTSPLRKENQYGFYHWHIEVLPKIHPVPGGFEVGTRVNINVIPPEQAAAMLRGKK